MAMNAARKHLVSVAKAIISREMPATDAARFTTTLDYELASDGDLAYVFGATLSEVGEEIARWSARQSA